MSKKVGLVLSGGAALGYAHVGVIKELEKNNIPIDIVVGTSMGGLVGASYACGINVDKMIELGKKFKNINFFDINFNKGGLFSGRGMMRTINKFLPDELIENLKIPFACVACDLNNEKEIVYKSGSVRDAVRATISIPGLFVPVKSGNSNIVDGGIINNLPENVAKEMGADIIISVDVLKNYKIKNSPRNVMDALFYSINLSTKEIQKNKAKLHDVIIEPNLSDIKQMSFTEKTVDKCVKIGASETKKHIEKIKKLLK